LTGDDAEPATNDQLDTAVTDCLSEDGDIRLGGGFRYYSMNKVETQVVAGMKYKLDFKAISADGELKNIQCEVYFAPGSNDGKVAKLTSALQSSNENSTNATMGTWKSLTGYDANPGMNDDLDDAINDCLAAKGYIRLGGGYRYDSMNSAQTQVVAGIKYKIDFNAVNTNNSNEIKRIQCTVYFPIGNVEGKVENVAEASE